MKQHRFLEGDRVIIHSLGPLHGDQEYEAVVHGVSVDYGDNPATIYIVETNGSLDQDYKYSCCTFPQSCMRRAE
jgi:hypothetical protein